MRSITSVGAPGRELCRCSRGRAAGWAARRAAGSGGGGAIDSAWNGRSRTSSPHRHFDVRTSRPLRKGSTSPNRRTATRPSESDIVSDVKTRDDALSLLHQYTKSDALRKHALAVEQAMKACARKFAPDEDPVRWGIAGLLHDFDYEQYPNADQHPYVGSKILEEAGFDPDLRHAIMGHAPYTGIARDTLIDRA